MITNESVDIYQPSAEGQKRFVHKHFGVDNRPIMAPGFEGNKDRAGNTSDLYRGVTKVAPRPGHGYAAAPSTEDEKVYEGKTYRKDDNTKHMKRSGVKKYLQNKKRNDEKRLQEDQQLDELSKKTLSSYAKQAADNLGVRGMQIGAARVERDAISNVIDQSNFKSKIKQDLQHSVEIGSAEVIKKERRAARNRTVGIGRAIDRITTRQWNTESAYTTEAFGASRGYRRSPDNPKDAHETYIGHVEDVKELLNHINKGVQRHVDKVSAPAKTVDYVKGNPKVVMRPGKAHWGHVGDMKQYRRQLEDIRDSLTQQGECASPSTSPNYQLHPVANRVESLEESNKNHPSKAEVEKHFSSSWTPRLSRDEAANEYHERFADHYTDKEIGDGVLDDHMQRAAYFYKHGKWPSK